MGCNRSRCCIVQLSFSEEALPDDGQLALSDFVAADAVLDIGHKIRDARQPMELKRPLRYPTEGGESVSVYFDTCSSRSGRQRAFVNCRNRDHDVGLAGGCRLYRYIDTFDSDSHCAAFLVAWALSSNSVPTHAGHLALLPAADLLLSAQRHFGIDG